ncbi:hypothetical protein BBO99_00002187 [Phytophthora kernoviae]|uniref:Uncharacterized protein n=2 Tax=Phytophthora kernoviae TaxID=325452 RepID=A0A3R7H2B1_9STRA|nr:hypothetical protein G195_002491 [Phytophthora kernoviae 00238/432]KAG2529853.1 hypothetical protein JM16_001806 [Phytophthora kernoviae]KAG2531215.1 hypothetical protein JM18_001793 [Phytophthora kernoviae]RLN10619.1 hypothetical protein BBI17_001893 [Phytophthora kernoviae]RLN83344.1 hypothetical protein BBO99_00002187 [Phytophthora kernoviae]
MSLSSRRGAPLGSLKAYYRKLRTFKGTVQALIYLRRTPLLQPSFVKIATPSVEPPTEGQRRKRSAVLEVPRISTTPSSTVQTQVHKLAAEGHIVAEIDPTAGQEVTYREQGNLDHYTEVPKRVSLQQYPHMIALTQRLWNCALRNGEKKLRYTDYETYMLCLHRLILPEFNIAASKELIMDDWKRDSGEKDYLDYAFFHLSMFELVDLWTDTVDPEDYIALLYCITHCLTYPCNDSHALKSLEDIHVVDILAESKEINLEGIDQDLEREMTSDSFAYYQEQVKIAAEANQAVERGMSSPSKLATHQQGRSRAGSGSYGQGIPKRKFSHQSNTNGLNFVADVAGAIGVIPLPLLKTRVKS